MTILFALVQKNTDFNVLIFSKKAKYLSVTDFVKEERLLKVQVLLIDPLPFAV